MALDDYHPLELAHQHITMLLVGVLAKSAENPEEWLAAFRQKLQESIEAWHADNLPDHEAAAIRTVTHEAAAALFATISLRSPWPPVHGR